MTLHVGEKEYHCNLRVNSTEVVFPDFTIPKGDVELSVEISGDVKREDTLRFLTIEKNH